MTPLWPLACVAAWAWGAPRASPRRTRRRLELVAVGAGGTAGTMSSPATARDPTGPPGATLRVAGAFGAAVAVCAVLGLPVGAVVAVPTALSVWSVSGRLESAALRRRRTTVARELPFALDLLDACLSAGASLDRALVVVGAATGGVVGDAFGRAGAALEMGATVSEAVARWRDEPSLAGLSRLGRLMVRSAASGTSVATACSRLATDMRGERRWDVDAVARRLGVRATAPLGLCFLPAFVLLGIVPIVLSGAHALLGS